MSEGSPNWEDWDLTAKKLSVRESTRVGNVLVLAMLPELPHTYMLPLPEKDVKGAPLEVTRKPLLHVGRATNAMSVMWVPHALLRSR